MNADQILIFRLGRENVRMVVRDGRCLRGLTHAHGRRRCLIMGVSMGFSDKHPLRLTFNKHKTTLYSIFVRKQLQRSNDENLLLVPPC
jgi:hypothetical protein